MTKILHSSKAKEIQGKELSEAHRYRLVAVHDTRRNFSGQWQEPIGFTRRASESI